MFFAPPSHLDPPPARFIELEPFPFSLSLTRSVWKPEGMYTGLEIENSAAFNSLVMDGENQNLAIGWNVYVITSSSFILSY